MENKTQQIDVTELIKTSSFDFQTKVTCSALDISPKERLLVRILARKKISVVGYPQS